MKKRFIVSINATSTSQDAAFILYLRTLKNTHGWGIGWWHWLTGTWLISDPSGHLAATSLRDSVKLIYTSAHVLVFELPAGIGDSWAAFGPKNTMLKWLEENWKA